MEKNTRGRINVLTGLTDKEQQFAMAYVANSGNVSQASKQVGISRVTGQAYLKKQRVLDFMATLGESAGEDVLSAQDVLRMLSDIATGKIKHQVLDIKSGKPVELEDVHAKNNALKQLARCYGMEKTVLEEKQTVFVIGGEVEEDGEVRERKIIDSAGTINYLLEVKEEEDNKNAH